MVIFYVLCCVPSKKGIKYSQNTDIIRLKYFNGVYISIVFCQNPPFRKNDRMYITVFISKYSIRCQPKILIYSREILRIICLGKL